MSLYCEQLQELLADDPTLDLRDFPESSAPTSITTDAVPATRSTTD